MMESLDPDCRVSHPLLRVAVILIVGGLLCGTVLAQQVNTPSGYHLKVMTRNLYQGTDFQEVMGSTDLYSFLSNVTLTMSNVRATKPAARVAAIAEEISAQQPDIVAVQEATIWRTGASPYAMTVEFDMLQLLLDELNREGTPYVPAKVLPQFDFAAPGLAGYVSTTTQLAILVRADEGSEFVVSNPQGGLFPVEHSLKIPIPFLEQEVVVARGWASVDVSAGGRQFRFITVHPEAFAWQYEFLQVTDLLSGPAATSLPVVMAADFNLRADDPSDPTNLYTYQAILGAGFTDFWAAVNPDAPGYTCCQLNSLINPKSQLDQRIDLIFTRGPFTLLGPKITGATPSARVDGLWPSDHAGLAGSVRLQ